MEQWLNDTFPVAVWEKKFFEIKKMQLKREEERKLEAMRGFLKNWLNNGLVTMLKNYIFIFGTKSHSK